MSNFSDAKALGVYAPAASGFLPYNTDKDGKIVIDWAAASRALANDSALSTTPNIGAPAALYTFVDPRIIEILFGVKNATQIFDATQVGDWTDDYANFPVLERAGQVSAYNDYANATSTGLNANYPARQNFRYQTTVQYGDLEVEKASIATIQLAAEIQRAAAETIAEAENAFYFFGVYGMRIYGLLNDPNIPTAISPISVDGNSTWDDKAAADGDNVANIVYNDINKLMAELTANNGGHISMNEKFRLVISNKKVAYLTNPNSFGRTALELLKANYPNMEVVQAPELSTDEGEKILLTVQELYGDATAFNAYSAKFRLGRLIPDLSSYRQKASAGTYGCVIRRPSLVAIMNGI